MVEVVLYEIKPKFHSLPIKDNFIARIGLWDKRTFEINYDTIVDLIGYIETPRIRKNLPTKFIKEAEYSINRWIDAIEGKTEDGIAISQDEAIKDIYELLYIEYPEVKRKFRECMRRRNGRLDNKGKTKWEVRRISIARKKGAKTREQNKSAAKENNTSKLSSIIQSLMSKSSI
jgi:hypothetical protein